MIGTKSEAPQGFFGNRGKGGIYFKDTGEQRPNFKEKGGTKTLLYLRSQGGTKTIILYLCSPLLPQVYKGIGTPLECAGSKGKFGSLCA